MPSLRHEDANPQIRSRVLFSEFGGIAEREGYEDTSVARSDVAVTSHAEIVFPLADAAEITPWRQTHGNRVPDEIQALISELGFSQLP